MDRQHLRDAVVDQQQVPLRQCQGSQQAVRRSGRSGLRRIKCRLKKCYKISFFIEMSGNVKRQLFDAVVSLFIS